MLWLNIAGVALGIALVAYELRKARRPVCRTCVMPGTWRPGTTSSARACSAASSSRSRWCCSAPRGQAGRAGRPLLPPPGAALDGQAGRQRGHLPLPRPAVRYERQLHQGARARTWFRRRREVKPYPVVEKNHWIWIWTGDPAKADPALIEDFHWMDDPAWRFGGSYLHVDGTTCWWSRTCSTPRTCPSCIRTRSAPTRSRAPSSK